MEEELLDRYAECATAIEANPHQSQIYTQLIEILTQLNLEQELTEAYANLAQYGVISTEQALVRINYLQQKLDPEPQSHLQLIQFYQESLLNYLCTLYILLCRLNRSPLDSTQRSHSLFIIRIISSTITTLPTESLRPKNQNVQQIPSLPPSTPSTRSEQPEIMHSRSENDISLKYVSSSFLRPCTDRQLVEH